MSAIDRGIGSEGLEQGGPSLGNDYSRKDLSTRNAGDALTTPNTTGLGNKDDDKDSLHMDTESSRDLSTGASDPDLEEDLLDDDMEDDDDDLLDLDDDDDDEEEDELNKGI